MKKEHQQKPTRYDRNREKCVLSMETINIFIFFIGVGASRACYVLCANQFMFTKLCELDVLTTVIAHHFQKLRFSRWYSALFPSSSFSSDDVA